MRNAFKLLKANKSKLTKQQFSTFRGQILHNDIEGFKKGLHKLIASNSKNKLSNHN